MRQEPRQVLRTVKSRAHMRRAISLFPGKSRSRGSVPPPAEPAEGSLLMPPM